MGYSGGPTANVEVPGCGLRWKLTCASRLLERILTEGQSNDPGCLACHLRHLWILAQSTHRGGARSPSSPNAGVGWGRGGQRLGTSDHESVVGGVLGPLGTSGHAGHPVSRLRAPRSPSCGIALAKSWRASVPGRQRSPAGLDRAGTLRRPRWFGETPMAGGGLSCSPQTGWGRFWAGRACATVLARQPVEALVPPIINHKQEYT